MTDTAPGSSWPDSPSDALRLDQACDHFEAEWKAGRRPRIEAYLALVEASTRAVLFANLLTLELTFRGKLGEYPTREEYGERFPEYRGLLDPVFSKLLPAAAGETLALPARFPDLTATLGYATATSSGAPAWPKVPGYNIEAELGRGGMGVVYRARQLKLNRLVALKMIRDGALAGPELRRRFYREAEVVARFQHPNLVRIYDIGEWEGHPFFSMEFAEGGSLDRRLREGLLPVRAAAELVKTLAAAMHYAHQKQIVHRDLKPANVLLTEDGRPMVADFGLAKPLDQGDGSTPSDAVVGTASYMAPEQALGKAREAGPGADVYALGAILFELLTGTPPFRGDTWYQTVHQLLHEEPQRPSRLRPEVPSELEAVCLRCLRKQPDQRFKTAEEMAEALRRYLAGTSQVESELVRHAGEATAADLGRVPTIPGYQLLERVSRFSIDPVYKARQLSLDRVVALKILGGRSMALSGPAQPEDGALEGLGYRNASQLVTPDFLQPESLQRRLAAWRAAARLQHTNILSTYDSGEWQGLQYVAEEFVEGVSLEQKIGQEPQPCADAARLIETLATAIHHAHQQGIIHRGLRPSCVLLTPQAVPKISSFELAKLLGNSSHEAEPEGLLVGVVTHMAPEQVAGRMSEIGPATDVYSLGVILYQLLTGRLPFEGDAPHVFLQVLTKEPPRPAQTRPDVPPALEAICLQCLEKSPGKRYGSANDLAEDLRKYLTAPRRSGTWRRWMGSWLGRA